MQATRAAAPRTAQGKRKFIDKNKAQTFSVVRRSQRDPLIADETSSPLVLVPRETRRAAGDGTDQLRQVVEGQEAFFDQVPGRAAAGRALHAPPRRRTDRNVPSDSDSNGDGDVIDDHDDDDDEEEDDDADVEGAAARPVPAKPSRPSAASSNNT